MRVWDLPLRVFHWFLMVAVIAAIGSSKAGVMWAHERFGLTIMGLVIFRLIWGFLGGHHARFANFIVGPRAVIAWVLAARGGSAKAKSDPVRAAGHSPMAAYSVLALLAIVGFMAASGSMSNDDILFEGPLAHLVPRLSSTITGYHHLGQFVVFALVGLHVGAIIYYKLFKKQALTAAMVHGRASDPADKIAGPDGAISGRHTLFGLGLMAVCIGAAHLLPLLRPAW